MPPNEQQPRWDMRMPFWALLIACLTSLAAYYGQREATNVALAELRGDLMAVKSAVQRMEADRYTASDARRDFAWRDERSVEQGRRITEMEADRRRDR